MVILPGAIATASGFAGANKGQGRTLLILAAILCGLVLASLNVYQEYQKAKAVRTSITATAALARALGQAGQPLVLLLGKVASATSQDDRRARVSTLVAKTVGIAHSQCGKTTGKRGATRAVYYHFVSPDHLVRKAYEGRGGRVPRPDFLGSRNSNDKEVVEVALGENSLLIKDVDEAPPHYFSDYNGRPYQSFLMVPVRTEERSYGFLSVDSDLPDSLTDIDVGYASLMAGLLAAAFALLGGDFPELDSGGPLPTQQTRSPQSVQGGTN